MEIIKLQHDVQNYEAIMEITEEVQAYVTKHRIKDGILILQTPEKEVGVTILDNHDPAKIEKEFLKKLNHLMPKYDGWSYMGPETAGVKASITGHSQSLIVENGMLLLGFHQGIFATFYENASAEHLIYMTHFGTTLAEGEEPALPKEIAEIYDVLLEKEAAEEAERQRVIEDMRREYNERLKRIEENPDCGLKSDRDL